MKFFSKPVSRLTIAASVVVSCTAGAIRWICGREQRITAEQYAREHKLAPLAVVAAAIEGRINPPAFWERGPEMPETFAATGKTILVLRSAVIQPRQNNRTP